MPECCSGTSIADMAVFSYGVSKMFQNAPFQAKINNQKFAARCNFRAQKYTKMR